MLLRVLGVAGIAFGVLGLRVMARRSVSLALLRTLLSGEDPLPAFEAAVAARIADAERHGLLREEAGRLVATARGRAASRAVRLLRRGFGVGAR
jgi:hypothetical protein